MDTQSIPSILYASSSSGHRKCKECDFFGPEESFPFSLTSSRKRLMNCAACTQRMRQREENKRAKALRKEQGIPELESIPTISLDDMLQSLESRRGQVLSLDAYVVLPQNLELPELESRRQKPGTEDVFRLANAVRNAIHRVTGFRWSQKKRTPTNGDKATVVTYHCAQLEEERPKHKERARVGTQPRYSMQRYHCNGWLNIYVTHGDNSRVRVRLTHDLVHPYPTHSKPEKMAASGMQSIGDDRTSVNITEQGQGNKRIRTADESQETLWIPPVVASSCLPPSVNKDRVSSINLAIPALSENFQRILAAASVGVDPHTATRIDVLFMEITRLGESLRSHPS